MKNKKDEIKSMVAKLSYQDKTAKEKAIWSNQGLQAKNNKNRIKNFELVKDLKTDKMIPTHKELFDVFMNGATVSEARDILKVERNTVMARLKKMLELYK